MTDFPVCHQCKHCIYSPRRGFESARCERDTRLADPDPVSGRPQTVGSRYCRDERRPLGLLERMFGSARCGPGGKHFEIDR